MKRIVSGIILALLLIGMLALAVNIQLVKAQGTMFTDDFSTDSGMWSFVQNVVNIGTDEKYPGSAYRDSVNEYMVLTENRNTQAGVIWLNYDIFSSFTVEFKYKAGGGTGADGLVFMFYKRKNYDPYDGGGLGFVTPPGGQMTPTAVLGYGIEFDNWYNFQFNDPSGNHIALIKDHVNNHLKYVNDPRTGDNQWHNVKITVDESSIEAYVDNETLFMWEGTIDRTYGGLGFSASTAAANNWHIIDDVNLSPIPPPLSVSVSPLSASILVGQSVFFTSTVSGGYTPYIYQWYLNGAPVSGATSASWAFTPTASGIYYVYLKVTDAKANTSQSDTARITVTSVPVGGYSIPIQVHTKAEPIVPYIASVVALTAILNLRRKIKRKR